MAQGTCIVGSCEKPAASRGWCEKHYTRWRRTGTTEARRKAWDLTLVERINAALDKSGDCWLWQGKIDAHGYGILSVKNRQLKAHRLVFEMFKASIPPGSEIDHQCRVRACCNPDHLRLATHKQNSENVAGRGVTGKRNVYLDSKTGGYRVCVHHAGRTHSGGRHRNLADADAAAIALRNQLFTHNVEDSAG